MRLSRTLHGNELSRWTGRIVERYIFPEDKVTCRTMFLNFSFNKRIFRKRFLSERHRARWEFTDSEVLSGIDGIFLSNQISNWIVRIRRLRLSQVIEMYYSARGIPTMAIESANRGRSGNRRPANMKQNAESSEMLEASQQFFSSKSNAKLSRIFNDPELELRQQDEYLERFSVNDGITSACNRKTILGLIDREKLKDETYFLSQVLQYTTSSLAVTDEALRLHCDAAVDNFFSYAQVMLDKLPACNQILTDFRKPVVDLTLIIDGSRGVYENQQLISYELESQTFVPKK